MYDASVPVFLQMLNNLSAILDKAEADAMNRKIDPEVLLNYRLAPDMFPFVRQIQIAADLAKGAAARLAIAGALAEEFGVSECFIMVRFRKYGLVC
jgi:hypothetical protein